MHLMFSSSSMTLAAMAIRLDSKEPLSWRKVLEESSVVIVGSECPELVAACKMIPAATMDEAIDIACSRLGASPDILIVPHAMLTLPVIQGEPGEK